MRTTIDRRTRFAGPAEARDAQQLFADLSERLAETGALAARGVELLGLDTLGFDVDGTRAHLAIEGDRLALRDGPAGDGVVAELDAWACSELFDDVVSTFGLLMAGRVQFAEGSADRFVAWEPALRAAIDDRPVYEPGSIDFRAHDGSALDLRRGFGSRPPGGYASAGVVSSE